MQKYKVPQKTKSNNYSSISDSFVSLQSFPSLQNLTGTDTFKSSFSEE